MPYKIKLFLFLLTGHVAVILAMAAQAATLDGKACDGLRQQRQELVKAGMGKTLEKGAQWASQNLDERQLGEVGTFLQLMEQIRFRCKGSKRDKKSKFGLAGNVPLPVRNSRRVKKAKADFEAAAIAKKAALDKAVSDGGNSETKAVISAITKNAGSKTDGAGGAMRKSIEN